MDKIICVGKNYLKHAIELGDPIPEEPLYFLKPASTLITLVRGDNGEVELPSAREIHHELELVLKIQVDGEGARFTHYTLGLDLTDRDLQNRLKKAGQPWEKAKVFKNAAILGPWLEMRSLTATLSMPFELKVNGELRQHGRGEDMRWGPAELLVNIAKWFPLSDGDILFTGTPEGVGPFRAGDAVQVRGGDLDYAFRVRA